jgi:hypothetical protein
MQTAMKALRYTGLLLVLAFAMAIVGCGGPGEVSSTPEQGSGVTSRNPDGTVKEGGTPPSVVTE